MDLTTFIGIATLLKNSLDKSFIVFGAYLLLSCNLSKLSREVNLESSLLASRFSQQKPKRCVFCLEC
jgi:hypothetical protein